VTRLTVVPLRSSPTQGNDKNLGPLSTPLGWDSDETIGKQKIATSARISILESRVADSLPKSFQFGIPIQQE
jgi:hypothetical protein